MEEVTGTTVFGLVGALLAFDALLIVVRFP